VYLVVPLLLANWLAIRLMRQARDERTDARALAAALAFDTIVYLLLNFAFFRFPWPWQTWTARTPNALCFLLCAAILLAVASAASSSRRGAPP
jgi:hypothetical protein